MNNIYETLNFALRKNIPIVYFNGIRIKLCSHSEYLEKKVYPRDGSSFIEKNEEQKERFNPHHLDNEMVKLFIEYPKPFENLDITDKRDARKVEVIYKMMDNSGSY